MTRTFGCTIFILSLLLSTAPAGAQDRLLIGNIHAPTPLGIAFVKNDSAGVVMRFSTELHVPADTTAPDGSYQAFTFFTADKIPVRCEWTREKDAAGIRLASEKQAEVTITLPRKTWQRFQTIYHTVPGGVDATCITGKGEFFTWQLRGSSLRSDINYLPEGAVMVHVGPGSPALMTAGFSELMPLSAVTSAIESTRSLYDKSRAKSTGDWADFTQAVADNLNFTRVYSTYDGRVAHTVARGWSDDPDYLPYFGWDSCFNALLASIEDPAGAHETLRALFTYQTPEGMIGNVSHWTQTRSGPMTIGNSQPPVGALCVWKIHQRWPDAEFLKEIYPKLVKWHEWWFTTSDYNHDGLLEWYSATGIFQEARFGCGWDDSPAFDGAKMIGTSINCDAVDLNALWSMDADYLARLADILGKSEDADRFRKQHREMNDRMNKMLWNETLGCYCSRLWDIDPADPKLFKPGAFITRLTPMNFYPLICAAPDKPKAERMLKILYDPKKFWGEYLIPTVAYGDPVYHEQNYWRGKTWAPVNYLLWQGLRQYADADHQRDFVEKSVNLFMQNWSVRKTCPENFLSTTGEGSSDRHYTWGALMCQIALEALAEPSAAGPPVLGRLNFKESITLDNIPSAGQIYRINRARGETTVVSEPR